MEKRCALGLFSFAPYSHLIPPLPLKSKRALKTTGRPSEESSDARTLVMTSAAFPARQLDHSTGKARGEYKDFVTGFVTRDGNVSGRPVGITVAKDGSLLFSEDGNGTIWRVSY